MLCYYGKFKSHNTINPRTQVMERKVSSDVGGTGLCVFFPKYIVHRIKAHKAAIELSDLHNVN